VTIAAVVVAGVAVYVVVRDLIRGYWTTRGARVERYTLHSRYVHRDLHEIRVVPAPHGSWKLVLLHGRGLGGHSPALWFSGAESAAGAFDDAEDYARHDIVNHPPRYSAPVWIDVGTDDPVHNAAVHYAREIHVELQVWPGGHDSGYWHSHMRQYLAFYASHCA
jgi:hypothetical protein